MLICTTCMGDPHSLNREVKGCLCIPAKWPIRPELIPVSAAEQETRSISTLPLNGMLVHHRVTPSIMFAGAHLHTWMERATVRVVKCLAQEHNTMSPARAWTWNAQSGDERTNYEATALPTGKPRNQSIKQLFTFVVLSLIWQSKGPNSSHSSHEKRDENHHSTANPIQIKTNYNLLKTPHGGDNIRCLFHSNSKINTIEPTHLSYQAKDCIQ